MSNTKNEQIAYASRQQAQRFNTMPSNFTCFTRNLYNCGGDSEFPVLWTIGAKLGLIFYTPELLAEAFIPLIFTDGGFTME